MKLKYRKDINEDKPVQIIEHFCWLPTRAIDERLNLGHFIVWLEKVYWNNVYKSWSIVDPDPSGSRARQS